MVYTTALARGKRQTDLVLDAPLAIPTPQGIWRPSNYSGEFRGTVRLREAFAWSLNTPAVRLAQETGMGAIVEMARALGVQTPVRRDLSTALGASEVTLIDQAVVVDTLLRGGLRRSPVWFSRPEAWDGRTWRPGDTLSAPELDREVVVPGAAESRAVSGAVAGQVVDMMGAVVDFGTARDARVDHEERIAKTGTSSDWVDAWTIGATPSQTIVVWIGTDTRQSLGRGELGGTAALPAWVEIADAVSKNIGIFELPGDAAWLRLRGGWLAMPRDPRTLRHYGRRARPGPLPPFPGADDPLGN